MTVAPAPARRWLPVAPAMLAAGCGDEGCFTFCGLGDTVMLIAQRGRGFYYQRNGSAIVNPRTQFRIDIVMPD